MPMLAVVATAALTLPLGQGEVGPPTLEERTYDYRAVGEFEGALELSRARLDSLRSDPEQDRIAIERAEAHVTYLEHAVTLGEEDRDELTASYALLAEVQQAQDVGGAIATLMRLIEIRERLTGGRHPDLVRDRVSLATFLNRAGQYAEGEAQSLVALEAARARWEGDHPTTASAMDALGMQWLSVGRNDDAREILLEARDMLGRLEWRDHALVSTLNNLAILAHKDGRFADARALYAEVLDLVGELEGEESESWLAVLMNLATVLLEEGDYAAAEPVLRRALADARRRFGKRHLLSAGLLSNLSVLQRARGDFEAAEAPMRECLAILEATVGESHPEYANTLANLATILNQQGRAEEAEAAAQRSLELKLRLWPAGHMELAIARNLLATVLAGRGQLDEAEALRREIMELAEEGRFSDARVEAANLSNLGSLLLDRGRNEEAVELFQRAVDMERKMFGPDHHDLVSHLVRLGLAHMVERRYEEALDPLEEAARVFEAARVRVGESLARATFAQSPYAPLAVTRLHLGDPEGAFEAMERRQGRALFDLLLRADQRALSAADLQREAALLRTVTDGEAELAQSEAGADAARAETARIALLEARAELAELEREFSERYPVREGSSLSAPEIRSALDEDSALIGWIGFDGPADCAERWCWVLRRRGPVRWAPVPTGSEAAAAFSHALVDASLSALGRPDPRPARDAARRLYDHLIAPAEGALEGARRLIVVATGIAGGLPLEALLDPEGRTLDERFVVSYVPSATIHTWLARSAALGERKIRRALLLGDPPFHPVHRAAMERERSDPGSPAVPAADIGALPRLPHSRAEVEAVIPHFGETTVLLGPDASEQELVRLAGAGKLATFDAIHLATHAHMDARRSERSALVLSQVDLPDPFRSTLAGERIYDGRLTAGEILAEWRLEAELVTLSACGTALGRVVRGEGLVGFAHAFFQVGARSLLVSLWPVDDEATALLMQRFYANLGGGEDRAPLPKSEALREAKRWLRDWRDAAGDTPFAHPCYWSSFILIGSPD